MKKFLNVLNKGKLILIILSISAALIGFLIAFKVVKEKTMLSFNFRFNEEISFDYKEIISSDSIEKTKSIELSWYTGSTTKTYKDVVITDIDIKKNNDHYTLTVNKDAFIFNDSYKGATARGFLKHLVLVNLPSEVYNKYDEFTELKHNDKYDYDYEIKGITKLFDEDYYSNNSLNELGDIIEDSNNYKLKKELLFSSIGLAIGFFIGLITIIILGYAFEIKKIEFDNEALYKTPFHKRFFLDSIKVFKDMKSLITISIILAIVMIFKFIPIPSGFGSLGLTWGFLFLSIACMIYGPFPAFLIGALSDLIGFLIRPTGPFFPGYTLDAMLACFTYAMLLHKTHITFTRCLISRVIVGLIINSLLGSIWHACINSLTFDATISYILYIALPKNIAYLIPQSILMFIVLKAVVPALKATGHIESEVSVSIF